MVAITKASSRDGITLGSPGLPNHSKAEPITSSTPNAAIHGLRRPLASAMAPSTGDSSAIITPAAAVAKPHSDCPLAGSEATWVAKYGANTKVVISVKYGCAAQSKNIQAITPERGGQVRIPALRASDAMAAMIAFSPNRLPTQADAIASPAQQRHVVG